MRFLSIYFHIQDMTGRQNYHCPGSYLKTASGPCENLVSRCRGDPLGDSRRGPAVKVHSSTLGGFTVRKHLCRIVLLIKALVSKPKKKLLQQIEARADINLRQGESAPFEDQPPMPRLRRS